jgi:hypothetical protein
MNGREGEKLSPIVKTKIWQPYSYSVSVFKNFSRRNRLDNKLIVVVRKRVKTHLRQCVQNFPGEEPPLEGEGKGGREEWKRAEGWRGKGIGSRNRKRRGGREGLNSPASDSENEY